MSNAVRSTLRSSVQRIVPLAWPVVLSALAGLAAAWIAAGSTGLLGHPLRHVLTWLAVGACALLGCAGAARWLARPDTSVAGVFGAGWQAEGVAAAHRYFRPVHFYYLLDDVLGGRPAVAAIEINTGFLWPDPPPPSPDW